MPYECQAVLKVQRRYKVPMVQKCQQMAAHVHGGVYLCGTHWNVLHDTSTNDVLKAVVVVPKPEI